MSLTTEGFFATFTNGQTVVYVRSNGGTEGGNIVILSDSAGTEAYSLITQPIISPLSLLPPTATVGQGGTRSFSANGGTPPYVFAVGDSSLGTIDEAGLYTGNTNSLGGSHDVIVFDSVGSNTTSTVTQNP